jgi:hypothetical protein
MRGRIRAATDGGPMSSTARHTRPLAGLLIAFVALACTGTGKTPPSAGGPAPTPSPVAVKASATPNVSPRTHSAAAASDAWLVVRRAGDDGLRVIRASTSEQLMDVPLGVPDETWGSLVTATRSGSTTVVRDAGVESGPGGGGQLVPGAWRLPTIGADPMPVGVSADGSTIVLVEDRAAAASAIPAATSRFAIVRRHADRPARVVELAGSFEFDTLSPDGSTLYVVEHLAGPPTGHYQVRAVDTASGVLRTAVVVDKTGLDEAMAGYPIAQLRRPDGMVFTLYRGAEHPFIHALSSIDGWALCIDLPATGADDAAAALDWGLAATDGGRSIVAVDATLGLAVEIPVSDLAVRKSVAFEPSASTGIRLAKLGHEAGGPIGRRVVASPDGAMVFAAGPGGIVRIGARDLTLAGRFVEGSAVDALGITPDGDAIYALLGAGGRIVKLDAVTGAVVGQVPGDGFDRLLGVIPW